MPLCVRCSCPNPPQSSRCGRCGAILPRVAGEESASSGLLSLEEGRTYSGPTQTFETENLARLRELLEDFLAGGDDGPVREWLTHLANELQDFSSTGVDGLKDALAADQQLGLPGDFPHQVRYLVSKGILLCQNGLQGLHSALDSDDAQAIDESFSEFQMGNDHLCSAVLLMADRKEAIDQALSQADPLED